MPELPEVETTRRGIAGHLAGATVSQVIVRHPHLRWPVPDLPLAGQTLQTIERRSKYLLFRFAHGTLIVHLGMTGSLRVLTQPQALQKHEHIDLVFGDGRILRYRDPRRFGAFLWTVADPLQHPLLAKLAPEPLSEQFDTDYLSRKLAGRSTPIKVAIMDSSSVVGVGNIYASESLFRAGTLPLRPAASLTRDEIARLIDAIRATLSEAIAAGGTTLRDYVDSDGNAGYFSLRCAVYGRGGLPCPCCGQNIAQTRQAQRATYWCPHCQH